MKLLTLCLLLLMTGLIPLSRAEDCVLKNSQDILNCAFNRHPDVEEARISENRDKTLKKVAHQRVNPEIESKMVTGEYSGNNQVFHTETTLLHTLEIGGKRGARLKEAQAQAQLANVHFRQTQEEVAVQIVLTANRLRQIRSEKILLRENRETFEKIIKSYKARSLLSPEQEVSVNVFETGNQEMSFKQALLLQEESSLMSYLTLATGALPTQLERHLPAAKRKWPEFLSGINSSISTFEAQAAAELELARGNLKMARSNAWPDIRLGPTLETERQSGDTTYLAGGSLQIPLPLLSHNRGKQAYARLEEQRANLHYETVREKTKAERQNQLVRYKSSLKTLNLIKNTDGLTEDHKNRDELFNRGLVNTSLMIESHRQTLELAEMRHKQELNALEALWNILIIDGKLSEGTL